MLCVTHAWGWMTTRSALSNHRSPARPSKLNHRGGKHTQRELPASAFVRDLGTVQDMGFLTDTVRRQANDPLRKLRRSQHAPDWLSGLGSWVAAGAVCLLVGGVVLLGYLNSDSVSASDLPPEDIQAAREVPVAINPFDIETPEPTATATGEEPDDTTSPPQETPTTSSPYSSLAIVNIRIADSDGSAPVPQGARDVALAGLRAQTTGQWQDIPLSAAAPEQDPKLAGAELAANSLAVQDPNVTGSDVYTFQITAVTADGQAQTLTTRVSYANQSFRIEL